MNLSRAWLLLLLPFLFLPCLSHAQVVGPGFVNYVTSAPSGTCSQGAPAQIVMGSGFIYTCQSGTWAQAGGGAGSCPQGTCVVNAPTSDQTIAGSHQLINLGTDQTGPPISGFDVYIQGQAFDPSSGEVAISGQNKAVTSFQAGVQGIAQGGGASGVYGLASDTQAGAASLPAAVEGLAFLTTTANNAGSSPIGGSFFSFGEPAVGTTVGAVIGVDAEAIVDFGTATRGSDFLALGFGVFNGGAFTNAYGFDAENVGGITAQTAAFHADVQSAGASHFGILLEGSPPNNLGTGTTKAGSFSAGTDNSAAGTLTLANGSANAHTIWSSGATTTNTIAGFTVVPTTGDLVTCTSASTTCTLTDSGILSTALAPKASPTFTGTVTLPLLATTTNCAATGTSANPSVVSCSAAPAGSFACATNASAGTCQVNTTAVNTASRIFVQPTAAANSLTCNAASDTGLTAPRLLSQSNGASFTITLGTFATTALCFNYWIVN